MSAPRVALQVTIATSLAVSGVIHAYLYIIGYREIPAVGLGFLFQGSLFCALAVLILFGGPRWLYPLATVGAAGSLIAFALSRTIGLFGFIETGWQPFPYTVVSLCAEALTIVLIGAAVLPGRLGSPLVARPDR